VIPNAVVTAWGRDRPWPTRQQVEQDLLLARLIVDIFNHPYLGGELVFRGGTCLHQLRLAAPRRYSEDLDFVRRTHAGIGVVFDALREVAERIGFEVASRVSSEKFSRCSPITAPRECPRPSQSATFARNSATAGFVATSTRCLPSGLRAPTTSTLPEKSSSASSSLKSTSDVSDSQIRLPK